jgi:hypothetical protein
VPPTAESEAKAPAMLDRSDRLAGRGLGKGCVRQTIHLLWHGVSERSCLLADTVALVSRCRDQRREDHTACQLLALEDI